MTIGGIGRVLFDYHFYDTICLQIVTEFVIVEGEAHKLFDKNSLEP